MGAAMSTVKYSVVRVMLLALALAALGALLCAGGGSALADEGAGGDTGALAAGGLAAQGTETDPDGTGGETGDAYAKFDSGTGTLTFFRSSEEYTTDQKETYIDEGGNEQTVTYYADIETTDWPASTSGFPRWRNHSSILTRVVFKDEIAPISTNGWFYAQRNLESIEGMEKLDTSKVTSMWYMFGLCQKLTELDVSHMDVSRVTNFGDMFASCSGLTELDLSGFVTSQAVNMSYMFGSCTSLTELDLSSFDTSNVTNMAQMFRGCERLAELDLSSFDTSNVTNMMGMFAYCRQLASLDVSRFDTSSVTDMKNMFQICSSLTSLDLTGWNTSSVTSMEYLFDGCSRLTSLDVSPLDTSNVESMKGMFSSCSGLTTLNLSGLDTSKVTDMSYMFTYCAELTHLDVSVLNTSQVKNFSEMFSWCYGLTALDLSGLDTAQAESMGSMFLKCKNLASVNLSNLDTSKVTYFGFMFSECPSLSNLNLSGLNTSGATDMRYMFNGCSGLTSLDVSMLDTSCVTNMDHMFCGCSSLTSLNMSGWDTSNVTTMAYMFQDCTSLPTLDVTGFDTSSVTSMEAMFIRCGGLSTIDVSGFDTSKVTSMGMMFDACGLTSLDVTGFDTSKVTYMRYMFYHCDKLAELDLSGFDTTSVQDMYGLFEGCGGLQAVKLGEKTELGNDIHLGSKWQLASLSPTQVRYETLEGFEGANPGWYLQGYGDLSIEGLFNTVYTGEPITPAVSVSVGERALGEGSDYTVSYASNVNAGTATVTVAGMGIWVGSTERTFEITAKHIEPTLTLSQSVFTYNGSPQAPDVVVKNGEDVLVVGTDYDVAFPDGCQEVGTYPVSVTLKGNYSGSASSAFEIVTNETVPTLALSQTEFTYNGDTQAPDVVVRDADGALIAAEDYDLDFPQESKDVGAYVVRAILKSGYSGKGSAEFKIAAKAIEPAVVLSPSVFAYDGAVKTPEVVAKDSAETLAEGVDYDVALPDDRRNVGTYNVEVVLKGNYSGSAEATFEIRPKETTPTITLSQTEYVYDGTEKAPNATARDGEVTLVEGVDYSISYPAGRTNAGTYAVRVTLKGNYAGSGSANFTITPKAVTPAVSLSQASYTYDGRAKTPAVTVKDGQAVLPASSYAVAYGANTNAGTATVRVTLRGNYAGTGSASFAIGRAAQAISASNASKVYGDAAFALGARRTAGDGALSYASSNPRVATVDANGRVTIKGAGTATVTVTAAATANYAAVSKAVTVTVAKAANTVSAKGKTVTVRYSKARKKAQTVKAAKAFTVKKAQGKVTYKVAKWGKNAKKYVRVASNGKVTVRKGARKGTYAVKVKVTAAGNANYKAKSKTVTLKVRVK